MFVEFKKLHDLTNHATDVLKRPKIETRFWNLTVVVMNFDNRDVTKGSKG